jgi:hypothetical protein
LTECKERLPKRLKITYCMEQGTEEQIWRDYMTGEVRRGFRKCLSTYQFTRLQWETVVMTHCDLNRTIGSHDHQNQVLLVFMWVCVPWSCIHSTIHIPPLKTQD